MRTDTRQARRNGHAHASHNHTRELRQHAAAIGDNVRGMVEVAGAATTDQLDPVQVYVREKPLRSILMAAGVGVLLGLWLRR